MQLVMMCLAPGDEIDLEKYEDLDQFIRVEQGKAHIRMEQSRKNLTFKRDVEEDWAALIPAGYYHNVKNIGDKNLKIYTLYAPGAHPEETVQKSPIENIDYEEQEEH